MRIDGNGDAYSAFLARKAQVGCDHGFEPLWVPDFLFDFQRVLVEWAIRKGRGAIFADCGLGKTPMSLVWAENVVRKTGRPVLILTPLAVAQQFVREGEKFGIEVKLARDGRVRKGINVVNYQRLHYFDPGDFVGLVCDESGVLKHHDAETRREVSAFASKVEYRLLGTATPAPNDYMELGNSSEVLGVMGYSQMLAMFFVNDCDTTQHWRLRGHAKRRFWQWMSGWSRAIRKPDDLGFEDGDFVLPELEIEQHLVPSGRKPTGLLVLPAVCWADQRAERNATVRSRCEKVAELAPADRPFIAWCHLNAEGDLLEKLLPDAVQVAGKDDDGRKEAVLNDFVSGNVRVLVTKPKIGGFGLNLQHCSDLSYFPSYCYDAETEVLTKRGWLRFCDVALKDGIATVNPETLAFEWQAPVDVVWSRYHGPMVKFGHKGRYARSFDLLVTPNHRMFVERCPVRYRKRSGKFEFKTASELVLGFKRQEYRMLSVPELWKGSGMSEMLLPDPGPPSRRSKLVVNRSGDRRGLSPSSSKGLDEKRRVVVTALPMEQLVVLVGWYVTEGDCGIRMGVPNGSVRISQSEKNADNRREIIALLRSIPGLHVNCRHGQVSFCSVQVARFLAENFGIGSWSKRLPEWIKELDCPYLELLRDTMLKGDGCGSGGTKWFYRTVSSRLADDFQEICLKTGVRASVRYREYDRGGFGCGKIYDVSLARSTIRPSIHCKPEIVDYDGMVGCVTVPNGTVIVRRKGIPIVSGNSWEQWYQVVRRCWRFGQQRRVKVRVVATEAESRVSESMWRKEKQSVELYDSIIREMSEFQRSGEKIREPESSVSVEVPAWL